MIKNNDDLEGLCISKNYLFYTNEKNNTINLLNLNSKKPGFVKLPKEFNFPVNVRNNRGIEAIEINEEKGLIYVLLEKDTEEEPEYSYVYVFDYRQKSDSIILSLISSNNGKIRIGPMKGYRYSDLVLHNNQLFLLRSKIRPNEYFIDKIKIERTNGIPLKMNLEFKEIEYKELTGSINKFSEKGYCSNIEGLTVFDNHFYIVSDNENGNKNDGNTLLLKIPVN
jgi:hypothetical protein